jgi:hypothetical protein
LVDCNSLPAQRCADDGRKQEQGREQDQSQDDPAPHAAQPDQRGEIAFNRRDARKCHADHEGDRYRRDQGQNEQRDGKWGNVARYDGGKADERRHNQGNEKGEPAGSLRSLFRLRIGDRSDDDPRQPRSAGGNCHHREQKYHAFVQYGTIGESQPPGDREGDNEEGHDLMTLDPIGYFIHDISP